MSNINNLVELLEEKTISLKAKINELQQENQRLSQMIDSLVVEKKDLENEIFLLKENNSAIKIANSILGSNDSKTEAKLKINTLIREIDACIVQLSK